MPFLTAWNFLKLTTLEGFIYSLWFPMFHDSDTPVLARYDSDFIQPSEIQY